MRAKRASDRVLVGSVLMMAICAVFAGAGLWTVSRLGAEIQAADRSKALVLAQTEADMMHDALRADVLAALLAQTAESGVSADSVDRDLAEHVASFSASLSEMRSLRTTSQVNRAIDDLDGPLMAYIQSAKDLVATARLSPQAARVRLPDFLARFDAVERDMGALTRMIDASARGSTDRAASNGSDLRLVMLALTLLFAMASLLIFGVNLDRKRIRQQGVERLDLALDAAGAAVFEVDMIRRQFWASPQFEALVGRIITFETLLDPAGADDADDTLVGTLRRLVRTPQASESDRVDRGEVTLNDGSTRWVEWRARFDRDASGRLTRVIGFVLDVDLHKQQEEALLEASRRADAGAEAKSQFLAVMSHEIRTPLNGVLGMTQAMAQGELSDQQRKRLEVVRQSGEALLAILNDVLDLSKIEAGRLELEAIPFDLETMVRGAYNAFTTLANKQGLSFRFSVEGPARGAYLGDPTRVRQILYNLISNALKFTPEGDVQVTVQREGSDLSLRVVDTGIGIAPERLEALFEKFTQADASTTRRFGGTGLGLSICAELTKAMGGRISVESTFGQGSTFTVLLPLSRAEKAVGDPPTTAASLDAEVGQHGLRILAAEDNEVNQLVLKTLLNQLGIDVTVVANGRLAVEAWRDGGWDAILMDMQMPEMDGLAATRAIRAEETASGVPRVPIIALTANAMAHQKIECLTAGMDAHVPKPIEIRRLIAALEDVLQTAPPQAAARQAS